MLSDAGKEEVGSLGWTSPPNSEEAEVSPQGSPKIYAKTCKGCRRGFTSSSRNTRFCSDKCAKKKSKRIKERRKNYDQTKDIQRLLASAYYLAEKVAELLVPKPEVEPGVELQIHHLLVDPLLNNPIFLLSLTKERHSKVHTFLPKINMIEKIKEFQVLKRPDIENQLDKLIVGEINFIQFIDYLWSLYKEIMYGVRE